MDRIQLCAALMRGQTSKQYCLQIEYYAPLHVVADRLQCLVEHSLLSTTVHGLCRLDAVSRRNTICILHSSLFELEHSGVHNPCVA